MLTYAQFLNSAEFSPDLFLDCQYDNGGDVTALSGFVYLGLVAMECMTPQMCESWDSVGAKTICGRAPRVTDFYILLGRNEYCGTREDLEPILYAFCVDEGYGIADYHAQQVKMAGIMWEVYPANRF